MSYLLEPLFECLVRRRKYEEYKYLEWTGNETLQLQRMAYQGLGSESWSGYTDSVPKTRPGYFLADLHVEYSVDRNEQVGPAVKRSTHTTNTWVSQSQAHPNVDQAEPRTRTNSTESSTNVQISPASYDLALPAVMSPSGVPSLEIPPGLMSNELNTGEPISPISQMPQPETPNLVVVDSEPNQGYRF